MNARIPQSAPGAPSVLNAAQALDQISRQWDGDIVRQLTDYIAIPAKSPMFDADWAQHGYIDTVVRNAADWVIAQKVDGLLLEVMRLPGRTPVLFFEVPASDGGTRGSGDASPQKSPSTQTVLMYGHLDKQPEFTGWRSDLGPWTPKYEDGKLYEIGRAHV